MKRAVALLLALAVFGAAGMVCAHRVVGASAEAVEMRETVISGDRAAAEDVEVLMHAAYGRCKWDTVLSIGAETTAETGFSYRTRISGGGFLERDYDGVRISVITGDGYDLRSPGTPAGWYWGPDFSKANPSQFGSPPEQLLNILQDVAARTAAGEKRTERLKLGDYFDFLPMDPWMIFPEGTYARTGQGVKLTLDEAGEWLCDYFRLPVPEGLEVNVTIEKDDAGDIVSWGFGAVDESALNMQSFGIVGGDACYFRFDEPGGDIDYSVLPWGLGLYRLPLERDGEALVLRLDELEQVVPLADGERVREMDFFGSRFLLLTQLDGVLYLTSVNLENMSREETIAMCGHSGEGVVSNFILKDGSYYVETAERRYALAVPEGDGYRLRLCGELSDPDWSWSWGNIWGADMLWDGERLIVAKCFDSSTIPDGVSEAGVRVCVYGETGLLCALRYDSGLADSPCLVSRVEGRLTAHSVGMLPPELELH